MLVIVCRGAATGHLCCPPAQLRLPCSSCAPALFLDLAAGCYWRGHLCLTHFLCLCACSNFAPLELAEFQKLMNSVKRGDIVGVAGELK